MAHSQLFTKVRTHQMWKSILKYISIAHVLCLLLLLVWCASNTRILAQFYHLFAFVNLYTYVLLWIRNFYETDRQNDILKIDRLEIGPYTTNQQIPPRILQTLAIFIHGMPEGDILQKNNQIVVGLNELWSCDCSPLHNRIHRNVIHIYQKHERKQQNTIRQNFRNEFYKI